MTDITGNNTIPVRIVGPGAIGSALGVFLNREFSVGFCQKDGATSHTAKLLWGDTWQEVLFPKPLDPVTPAIYLFAVKAFDVEQAMTEHLATAPSGSIGVSLANGFVEPILQRVQKLYPSVQTHMGYCNFGVSSQEDGAFVFRSKGAGRMFFGPWGRDKNPSHIAQRLAENEMCHWSQDILEAARTKWIYNTVLNSFCAAHKLKCNGDALNSKAALKSLFEEAWGLAEELFGGLRGSKAELFMGLQGLIGDTGANENSMARDVRLGKPTESDYLAGLALGFGERFPGLVMLHKKVTGA
jgi:ketopantoate reductase